MRRVAVATVLAAAVLADSAAPSASAAPRCSPAEARAAVRAAGPRLERIFAPDTVVVSAKLVSGVLCHDFTRDGRTDMAVTIFSGGTAGDVGWVVFVRAAAAWRLGRAGTGYKLSLVRAGRDFEVVQPVYRRDDPNCCPTGGFDHVRYGWNGSRFVIVREYHTRTFRRP
jgi:hypothetical protein